MKALLLGIGGALLLVSVSVGGDAPTAPVPTIKLLDRHGHVMPHRQGFEHTGGGNIDVAQPTADTLIITMSGVAVAGAHPCKDSIAVMDFDLTQCFEIALEKPEKKKLSLSAEVRVIGLLRSHTKKGVTQEAGALALVSSGTTELLTISAPAHSVCGGENLSINDRAAPVSSSVNVGNYVLHQTFHVSANQDRSLFPSKAASSEFAPDPALDPLWISYSEPFHGATKKDFGFQVTLKVALD